MSSLPDAEIRTTIIGAILTLALMILIRTAWISDDAAITVRTVLNFIHGYGPVFNIDERVQAYTHPLWFLLISALSVIFGNPFYTIFVLSITISFFVFWLLISQATNFYAGLLATSVLILSKAYMDFSTSGLENPLSHLLVIAGIIFSYRSVENDRIYDQIICFLSCSLLYLSRPDLLVLIGPFFLVVLFKTYRSLKKTIQILAIISFPVLIWTAFSLIYYGFPFPNTAYAKLGTGISLLESANQGWFYFLDSVSRDPITLPTIALGLIIGFKSSVIGFSLALGCVFYLAYIVTIGGDFMSGRFFTPPLLVAAIICSRSSLSIFQVKILAIATGLLGLANINANLLSGSFYPHNNNQIISLSGIADERGGYFQQRGLLLSARSSFYYPEWGDNEIKTVIIACGGIGYASINSGPSTHFIDECALADPLLARLPAQYNPKWRIGHFIRQIPTNYMESVKKGVNLLADSTTKKYYDSIRVITRGPLFERERLYEILRINLGLVKKPDWDLYKYRLIPPSSSG